MADMMLPERMIHQSTRYVLGRMSYAVSTHCEWLIANWARIPENERRVIQDTVEEAFGRYERGASRELGRDCDVGQWRKVRALWQADKTIRVSEGRGLNDQPNATCSNCGRTRMLFEGFI